MKEEETYDAQMLSIRAVARAPGLPGDTVPRQEEALVFLVRPHARLIPDLP